MSSKLRKSFQRSFSYSNTEQHIDEDPVDCSQSFKRRSSIFHSAWNILTRQNKKKKSPSISSVVSETDLPDDDSDSDTTSFTSNQKHEDAWLQACYSAVALLFFFITGCVVLAVYYILEPFLHPLLWAVLFGMVFHPFKHASTWQIKQWLMNLDCNGVPLTVGLVLSPLAFFNWMTQYFEYIFISSWKTITALVTFIVSLFIAYILHLPMHIHSTAELIYNVFTHINHILSQTVLLLVISLAFAFVLLVALLTKQSEHFKAMKILSVCVWFLALLNVGVYLLGTLAVPIVITIFGVASLVNVLWPLIRDAWKQRKKARSQKSILKQGLLHQATESLSILGVLKDCGDEESLSKPLNVEDEVVLPAVTISSDDLQSQHIVLGESSDEEKQLKSVSFGPTQTLSPSRLRRRNNVDSPVSNVSDDIDGRFPHPKSMTTNGRAQSDRVFLILLIACLIVTFWKYPILLLCLVPFTIWCAVKRAIFSTIDREYFFCNIWLRFKDWIKRKQWILFPSPMPTILNSFLYLDKKVLNATKSMIGSLVSACIIIFIMVLMVTGVVFFFFEIQVEVTHYVTVGITVWNGSVASHLHSSGLVETVEKNDSLQQTLEAFANQSYVYGREWIANKVHSLVSDSSDNTSAVEARILDLFDQLYQSYILKNTSFVRPDFSASVDAIENSAERDKMLVEIRSLLSNNLETILSVLKSVWAIISENMTVALSSFSALVQLLFTGSSALFNLVVFISALFYLLSYSEAEYLPVKWIKDLLPNLIVPSTTENEGEEHSKKEQGEAFSKAIRSVFHASLRRAFFSGLYTWLIHTMFGMSVSILPSVLAGIAGALPFVGSYWVTLPAVLELWLIEGRPLVALLLFLLSLVPVFYVDTLINSEIEGGHPYLTGLAIAGGIYFAGLEGAIFGPILLSCLIFFVDFYGDVFNT